jgi:hypothetical protein
MNRLVLLSLWLSLTFPSAAIAQVKIGVSAQHYKLQEQIHAKVENTGSGCSDFLYGVWADIIKGS